MTLRYLGLVCVLVGVGCSGEASKDKQPSPQSDRAPNKTKVAAASVDAGVVIDRSKYKMQLDRGRRLVASKKYSEAVSAFHKALTALPKDPTALAQLGWAAFHKTDLVMALNATRSALRGAKDPRLRAATLYNLGRIFEAKADNKRALRAYNRSMRLRPHSAVRSRLAKLGAATKHGMLVPLIPSGPFRSEVAACEHETENAADCARWPKKSGMFENGALKPPLLDAKLFHRKSHGSVLLMRTTLGWFTAKIDGASEHTSIQGRLKGGSSLVKIRTVGRYRVISSASKWRQDQEWHHLLLCAAGKSQRPTCYDFMTFRTNQITSPGGSAGATYRMDVRLVGTSRVTMKVVVDRAKGGMQKLGSNMAKGTHKLAFP